MLSTLLTNVFSMEELAKAEMEIERVFYIKMADFEELKKANVVKKIEQYEMFSVPNHPNAATFRVRCTDDKLYQMCIKLRNQGPEKKDTLEKEFEIDKEVFEMFRLIAPVGTIRNRFEFNIDGTTMKWEVDVYSDNAGKYYPWAKVDLEVKDRNAEVPEFPISTEEFFEVGKCTVEQSELKNKLFEDFYNIYNKNNFLPIQSKY